MAKVAITYLYPTPRYPENAKGLEGIINLYNRIKTGMERVESKYSNVAKYSNIAMYVVPTTIDQPELNVHFEGEDKSTLYEAVKEFIESAGVPHSVDQGHNLIEPILNIYGKKLGRSLFDFGNPKYVVDIQ